MVFLLFSPRGELPSDDRSVAMRLVYLGLGCYGALSWSQAYPGTYAGINPLVRTPCGWFRSYTTSGPLTNYTDSLGYLFTFAQWWCSFSTSHKAVAEDGGAPLFILASLDPNTSIPSQASPERKLYAILCPNCSGIEMKNMAVRTCQASKPDDEVLVKTGTVCRWDRGQRAGVSVSSLR